MKAKNVIAVLAGFIFYFIFRGIIFPYENTQTHPSFNEAIVKFIEENSQNYFPSRYSIKITQNAARYTGKAVTDRDYFEISHGESDVDYTVLEWIKHGGYSADEPEFAASVRHFFDPLALSGGRKYLTNRGTYWEWVYPNPHVDAIEWALGDSPKGQENEWSLKKGKEYLQSAFELADESLKNTNLAKAFRCLGEVLHNTGDMGCPPHTRNDSHAAPLGYTGGAVLGSPDPNEELFDMRWISIYMYADPDPNLKSFCDNATSIRSINEKLAEFTNANFFTSQTINGVGNETIEPINKDGNYPSPLLQNLEYNASDFIYYKNFPSGNKIKMAKDRSYFIFRGYPYIDRECVMSQANELVPNIICAGTNIIRLFIPRFTVKITSVSSDWEVEGTVTHNQTEEYNSVFYYSGKINIYNSENSTKIGSIDCNTGDFRGTVSGLESGDEIYANLELAGINIRSDIFKVGDINKTITGCSIFLGGLKADFIREFNTGRSEQLDDYSLSAGFPPEENPTVSFSNNILTQETNFTGSEGNVYTGTAIVTFNEEMDTVLSLSVDRKIVLWSGSTMESSLTAIIIPIDKSSSSMKFRLSGDKVCSNIETITYVENWKTYKDILIENSWQCNEDSELEIDIYAK